jgi:hypothetical protein
MKKVSPQPEPEPAPRDRIDQNIGNPVTEPAAPVTVEPAPAPATSIWAALNVFRPSQETKDFCAALGGNAVHIVEHAKNHIDELAYAIRCLRTNALSAAFTAHQKNDANGYAAAMADVEHLNQIIANLKG